MNKLLLALIVLFSTLGWPQANPTTTYAQVTNAQMLTAHSVPIVIDGNYGGNKLNVPIYVWFRWKPETAVAMVVPAGSLLELFDGSVDTGCGIAATGFLDQTQSKWQQVFCTTGVMDTSATKNQPLQLKLTGNSNPTGGAATEYLEVYLTYLNIDLPQ